MKTIEETDPKFGDAELVEMRAGELKPGMAVWLGEDELANPDGLYVNCAVEIVEAVAPGGAGLIIVDIEGSGREPGDGIEFPIDRKMQVYQWSIPATENRLRP